MPFQKTEFYFKNLKKISKRVLNNLLSWVLYTFKSYKKLIIGVFTHKSNFRRNLTAKTYVDFENATTFYDSPWVKIIIWKKNMYVKIICCINWVNQKPCFGYKYLLCPQTIIIRHLFIWKKCKYWY